MHAHIAFARRAALLAIIAIAAACSNDDPAAPIENPGENPPPGQQPPPTNPPPAQVVASIEVTGDTAVVATYMGWLRAKPRAADGTELARTVTWQSDDPSVVTVDAVGAMIGRKPGLAVITAFAEGRSTRVAVRVVRRATTTLDVSPIAELHRGDVGHVGVLALDQYRQVIHEPDIALGISDPTIARLDGRDIVPLKAGAATITITSDGVTATAVVRVASETTWQLGTVNGHALPAVILESVQPLPAGSLTRRLVATQGSVTISNVTDTWSQRLVVEEWEYTETQGNVIATKVATHVSTEAGTFAIDASSGQLMMRTAGSTANQYSAFVNHDGPRSVRVVQAATAEDPAFIHVYER